MRMSFPSPPLSPEDLEWGMGKLCLGPGAEGRVPELPLDQIVLPAGKSAQDQDGHTSVEKRQRLEASWLWTLAGLWDWVWKAWADTLQDGVGKRKR